jgi:hypothetical protein
VQSAFQRGWGVVSAFCMAHTVAQHKDVEKLYNWLRAKPFKAIEPPLFQRNSLEGGEGRPEFKVAAVLGYVGVSKMGSWKLESETESSSIVKVQSSVS